MSKRYKVVLFFVICGGFISLFFIFPQKENAVVMGVDDKHISVMYPQYKDYQDESVPQSLSNGGFEDIMYEHFSINQVTSADNPAMIWNSTSGNVDVWNQYYYDAASGEQYVAISQDYIYHYVDQQFTNGQKVRYSFDHGHGGDKGDASLVFELVNLNGETLYTSDFYSVSEEQGWVTQSGEFTFNQDVSGLELRINPTDISAFNLVDNVNFSYATAPTFSNTVTSDTDKIDNESATTINTTITRVDDFSDTQWTNQTLEVILPSGSVIPTTAYATYSDGTTVELSVSQTSSNSFVIYGFSDVYFDDMVVSFDTVFSDTELESAEIITNYKYTAATSVGSDVAYNVYGIDVIEMKNNYELTFDTNGASNSSQIKKQKVEPTTSISEPNITLTKDGYRFVGWSTSIDASTGMWDFDTNIMPPADTTLYAIWELDTYTVNYDVNGGDVLTQPSSQEVVKGYYVANPITPSSMYGYFSGWNTSSDGTGTMWDFNTMPMPGNDVTLYAQWTPYGDGEVPSYLVDVPASVVYFDPNYGDLLPTGQVYPVGTVISQPTNISRPGYTLVGFSTTPSGESGLWDFSVNPVTESSYTLYAQWTPEVAI